MGITVTAELDDRNAALADALWEALPYQSLQGHALVAGHHLYHVAPIPSLLHLPASHPVVNAIRNATGLNLTHTPVKPEHIVGV